MSTQARQECNTDVLVIGGGIVGASAALALRRKGVGVTLIERDYCGSRSSGVNYGGVRRQGRPLVQLPLAQRAHQIWARLPELLGIDGEYQRTGHLKIARSEADMDSLRRYAVDSQPYGLGLQILEGAELRRMCPWLGGGVAGGSLCPEDGQANPRLVSPAFARAAERAGARLLERQEVVRVEHDGSVFHVETRAGVRLRAPQLLNAAGAWAGALAADFGEPVPMVANHPAMAVTEPIAPLIPWSLGVEGGSVYCRQVSRGNVVLGGGRGFAQDASRARTSHQAVALQLLQIVDLIPALRNVNVIRTWSGTEGYLPDRQPVLGASSRRPGLFHAFGFAGAGFQIGPAVGEVMAELIADGQTTTPIDAFSIDRFLSPGMDG